MQTFIFLVFCLALTYFQVSALPIFFDIHRIPNIVLSFLVSVVILKGFRWSLKWLFLLGLLMDIFSFQTVGINIFGFLVAALIAFEIRSAYHLRAKRILFLAMLEIIILLSKLSFDISKTFIAAILSATMKYPHSYVTNFFSLDYFLAIFYTLIFAAPTYFVASRFMAWLYGNQGAAVRGR